MEFYKEKTTSKKQIFYQTLEKNKKTFSLKEVLKEKQKKTILP